MSQMLSYPSPTLKVLVPENCILAFEVACELREGRPQVASAGAFQAWLTQHQYPEGYQILAAFVPQTEQAVAFAGFRILHSLAWGRYLYIDDLITREQARGQGLADALFERLYQEARRQGCKQIHLDSGLHRHVAHRFYLNYHMDIKAYHFQVSLED